MDGLIERLERLDSLNARAARLRLDERDSTDGEAAAELRRLRDEIDVLRGLLATSELSCPYCKLPATDIAKCALGFPGCARADDLMATPGSTIVSENKGLREEVARLREALQRARNLVGGLTFAPRSQAAEDIFSVLAAIDAALASAGEGAGG